MARRIRGDVTTAAAVMMTGSGTFLVGAFLPVSRVYVETDPERKYAILLADPGQWSAQLILMGAGAAVLPVGVVMLSRHWDEGSGRSSQGPVAGKRLAQGAALALIAGAGLFLGHLNARYTDPEAFAMGNLPTWPFYGYLGLSLAGMVALGGGLLARAARTNHVTLPSNNPRWPGWLNVSGAGVFAAVLVATGDLPPLLIYVVELVTGGALIRQVRRGAKSMHPMQ